MIARLTDEDIDAAIAALAGANAEPERSYIKPLKDIGESLIEALSVEDGINLGLAQIDVLTRGFRPTDLVLITGFAHSAKTQLVNTLLVNNPDKYVLFLSLDDPSELLLAKLVAMISGVPSARIEQRIREGDEATRRLVRETAADKLPHLLIVDDIVTIPQMQEVVAEAVAHWGHKPDAVIVDYVDMVPNAGYMVDQGSGLKQKMNELKGWAKSAEFPIICVHQGTRSNARPGDPITMLSLGHTGEQQASLVLGCRRKRDKPDLPSFERTQHQDTVTVHLVKNKRPGGKLTHYEGIDFYLEQETGTIRPLAAADSAATAVRLVSDTLDATQYDF